MKRCVMACLWAVAVAGIVAAGEFNAERNIGDDAPAWKALPGTDGKQHSLADLKDKDAVIVVFTCNSCEVATDYEDRIIAFSKKHAAPGSKVALVAINVNKIPADSLEKMKERAKSKGFPFPYLFDETQKIAKDYGAAFTPEFFVLDKARKIAYMGSMDDNSDAATAKEHYLEDALAAVLEGKKVSKTETNAIGCRIRFAREKRKSE